MKKLFCITLIGLSTLFFVGCIENDKGSSTENNKPPVEDNANAGQDLEKPESNTTEGEPDKTERTFKIVTKNVDYEVVNDGEVTTVGLGVAENIKEILSTISKKYFDDNTIELTTIETIDSKKIAVINLTGDKDYWHQKMQGSAGGQITEYTLIENVLQREYKGYWINGVRFTLNGKEITNNSHSENLSKTTYR